MKNDSLQAFNKTEFILAFAALLIGFANFNTQLQNIPINLGFRNSNLWELSLFSFSLLFFSIYLYALDSIRYGVGFLESFKVFKYLRDFAHAVYFFAIISPLLIFLLWLIVVITTNLPVDELKNNVEIIATISTTLVTLISALLSFRQIQTSKKIFDDEINERASELLIETDNLSKNKNWRSVVIETFRILELIFKSKAEKLGLDAHRVPFIRLIRVFVDQGLISKELAAKLDELREIRNLAVHSDRAISKEQAYFATDIVDQISKSLAPLQFKAGYFEKIVSEALSKLFLKHHTFPQFGIGSGKSVDFMAEGPNHNYFIEIKMTESTQLIHKAIKQLQSLLGENDRGLLILPKSAQAIDIKDPRIKLVFFDIEKGKFLNEKEIYNWIYE